MKDLESEAKLAEQVYDELLESINEDFYQEITRQAIINIYES